MVVQMDPGSSVRTRHQRPHAAEQLGGLEHCAAQSSGKDRVRCKAVVRPNAQGIANRASCAVTYRPRMIISMIPGQVCYLTGDMIELRQARLLGRPGLYLIHKIRDRRRPFPPRETGEELDQRLLRKHPAGAVR